MIGISRKFFMSVVAIVLFAGLCTEGASPLANINITNEVYTAAQTDARIEELAGNSDRITDGKNIIDAEGNIWKLVEVPGGWRVSSLIGFTEENIKYWVGPYWWKEGDPDPEMHDGNGWYLEPSATPTFLSGDESATSLIYGDGLAEAHWERIFPSIATNYVGSIIVTNESGSLNIGAGNYAISPFNVVSGSNTLSGLKGYRWSTITFNPNPYLTLNKSLNGITDNGITLESGNVLSIINDSKYDNCSVLTNIVDSGSDILLYVNSLPFANVVEDTGWDAKTVFTTNNPSAGTFNLGLFATANGVGTKAINFTAHAEGGESVAYGMYSHAEGRQTVAGYAAHAEGRQTKALGQRAHAEGKGTTASGDNSHSEGNATSATGLHAHAEGNGSFGIGEGTHVEGYKTIAHGKYTHAEGYNSLVIGQRSHIEGNGGFSFTSSNYPTDSIIAEQQWDEADKKGTTSGLKHINAGEYAHVEGMNNFNRGNCAHVEGQRNKATGTSSHAEGWKTRAMAVRAHSEGESTVALGSASHAEGYGTLTTGDSYLISGAKNSVVYKTTSNLGLSVDDIIVVSNVYRRVVEVLSPTNIVVDTTFFTSSGLSNAQFAVVSGIAMKNYSHSEGARTKAMGEASHSEGQGTITRNQGEHASGNYNISVEGNSAIGLSGTSFSHGIGTSEASRTNAFEVMQDGKAFLIGVGGYNGTNSTDDHVKDVAYIIDSAFSYSADAKDKVDGKRGLYDLSYTLVRDSWDMTVDGLTVSLVKMRDGYWTNSINNITYELLYFDGEWTFGTSPENFQTKNGSSEDRTLNFTIGGNVYLLDRSGETTRLALTNDIPQSVAVVAPSTNAVTGQAADAKSTGTALYTGFTDWECDNISEGYEFVKCEWRTIAQLGTGWVAEVKEIVEGLGPVIIIAYMNSTGEDATYATYENGTLALSLTRHLVTPTKTSQLTNDGTNDIPFATVDYMPSGITDGTNTIDAAGNVMGNVVASIETNYWNSEFGMLHMTLHDGSNYVQWEKQNVILYWMSGTWECYTNDSYVGYAHGTIYDSSVEIESLIFVRMVETNIEKRIIGKLALTNDIPQSVAVVAPSTNSVSGQAADAKATGIALWTGYTDWECEEITNGYTFVECKWIDRPSEDLWGWYATLERDSGMLPGVPMSGGVDSVIISNYSFGLKLSRRIVTPTKTSQLTNDGTNGIPFATVDYLPSGITDGTNTIDAAGNVYVSNNSWTYTSGGTTYTESEWADLNLNDMLSSGILVWKIGRFDWGTDTYDFTGWYVDDGSGSAPVGISGDPPNYSIPSYASDTNVASITYTFYGKNVTAQRFTKEYVGKLALTNDTPTLAAPTMDAVYGEVADARATGIALWTGMTDWALSDKPEGYTLQSYVSIDDAWYFTFKRGESEITYEGSGTESNLVIELYSESSPSHITATRHIVTPTKTSQLTNDGTNGTPFAVITQVDEKQDKLPYPTNAIPYAAITGAPSTDLTPATNYTDSVVADKIPYALISPGEWTCNDEMYNIYGYYILEGAGSDPSMATFYLMRDGEEEASIEEIATSLVLEIGGFTVTRPSLPNHLVDHAINFISVASTNDIYLPNRIDSKSRDFIINMNVSGSSQGVTFIGDGGETITWGKEAPPTTFEGGTNILRFTEVAQSCFICQNLQAENSGGETQVVVPTTNAVAGTAADAKATGTALWTGFTEWEFSDGIKRSLDGPIYTLDGWGYYFYIPPDGYYYSNCFEKESDLLEALSLTFNDYNPVLTATRHLVTPTKTSQLTNDGTNGIPYITANVLAGKVYDFSKNYDIIKATADLLQLLGGTVTNNPTAGGN